MRYRRRARWVGVAAAVAGAAVAAGVFWPRPSGRPVAADDGGRRQTSPGGRDGVGAGPATTQAAETAAAPADRPLAAEDVVARASPAVFKVFTFGDLTVTTPYFAAAVTRMTPDVPVRAAAAGAVGAGWKDRSFKDMGGRDGRGERVVDPQRDGPTIAENEYKRDADAGVVPQGATKTRYCYERVIADPARYLDAERFAPPAPFDIPVTDPGEAAALRAAGVGNRSNVQRVFAAPYAEGTAFAVSREGVLLTNAHVVGKPAGVPLRVLVDGTRRTVENLEKQFAGPCPDDLKARLLVAVAAYLRSESAVVYSRRTHVVVVLDYGDVDDEHARRREAGEAGLADFLAGDGPRDNGLAGCVADVLAAGDEFPGKDVAVLKLRPDGTGVPEWGKPSKARARDWKDKLVCLPLGDSDRFALGGSVAAFGFPGTAVDLGEGALKEAAAFRVIPQDGSIGAREPTRHGWDALHMTAAIDHGHSGGPVVDRAGNVVAVNVAGPTDADGHARAGYAVAVPIDVAKEFLATAGVTPDPGPATVRWAAGQRLYRAGRYADAAREFEAVARLQGPEAEAAADGPAAGARSKAELEALAVLAAAGRAEPRAGACGAFSDVQRALANCRKRLRGE